MIDGLKFVPVMQNHRIVGFLVRVGKQPDILTPKLEVFP
jgi:hypothetical protein